MEIFKTDILKKEFEKFQKENLVEILKCDYFEKAASQSWHQKFLVSCKYCREAFCKACHNFNIAKETLFKAVDSIGKKYIEILSKIFFLYQTKLFKRITK